MAERFEAPRQSAVGPSAVAVVAAGDPRARTTWSGTPAALVTEFERRASVLTVSGEVRRAWDNPAYGVASIRTGAASRRFRHYWGFAHARDRRVWRRFRAAHPLVPAVHTDYMWLDPASVSRSDFLYRDCGWTQWSRDRGFGGTTAAGIADEFRAVLGAMGGVFATSRAAAEALVADGADPATTWVVGTGVGNLIRPYDGPKDYSTGRVLCVAKVREHDKGVDLLVEAFRLLGRRGAPWTLDLVLGEERDLGLPNVRTHTALPADALIALFQESCLFAMPARAEPHGLVYLEAELSRTPILGSDRNAFPEFAGDGAHGFIVQDLTAEAIAESIDDALRGPDRLASMGTTGQQYARSFSWTNTADRMWEALTTQG